MNEKTELLQSSLTHYVNENIVVKNKAKWMSERMKQSEVDNSSFYNDYMQFKSYVTTQLNSLNDQCKGKNQHKHTEVTINKAMKESTERTNQGDRTSKSKTESNTLKVVPGLKTYSATVDTSKEMISEDNAREVPTPQSMNHPTPKFGSLRFHTNDAPTMENSPDERGETVPLKTGDRTGNVHIFSSSMLRDVSEKEFDSNLIHGTAKIHLFRGKKASEIRNRVQDHLLSEKTDKVVILAGGNDLPTSRKNPTSTEEIANTIINIGIDCLNDNIPAENIHISSVLPRGEAYMQVRRKQINDALKEKCKVHKFVFIENKNIVLSRHIGRDGVHLNRTGTARIAKNFLDVLNGHHGDLLDVSDRVVDCSIVSIVGGD